jgi:voltage-gated potassium channel
MGEGPADGDVSPAVASVDTLQGVRPHAGMPPRRLLVLGAGRTLVATTGVHVLYFVLPLDNDFSSRTLVSLVLGMVAVGLLVAWQVHAILRAQTPALRAWKRWHCRCRSSWCCSRWSTWYSPAATPGRSASR